MLKSSTIAFITLMIALAASALTAAGASAATPDAPWSATGTATTTATSDGTTANPVLDYSVAGSSGNWKFSATATSTRQQPVTWRYKGYHAWFQVRVAIEKFVIRDGAEIATETLRSAGPVNCCTAPSGGFDYTGTTTFDLKAGDVYGFRMSGSHYDSDRRLIGTLSLSTPDGFSITGTDPATLAAHVGQAGSATISTAVVRGSSVQPVALSVSGLPAGATASFDPATVNAGGTSKLVVTTTSATPCGDHTLTITGTGQTDAGGWSQVTRKTLPLQVDCRLVNGEFSDGLSGWTLSGSGYVVDACPFSCPTSVWNRDPATKFFARLLGDRSVHNSNLTQTFRAPSSGTLSLWYRTDQPRWTRRHPRSLPGLAGQAGPTEYRR